MIRAVAIALMLAALPATAAERPAWPPIAPAGLCIEAQSWVQGRAAHRLEPVAELIGGQTVWGRAGRPLLVTDDRPGEVCILAGTTQEAKP